MFIGSRTALGTAGFEIRINLAREESLFVPALGIIGLFLYIGIDAAAVSTV
jgi:hypothetical protein